MARHSVNKGRSKREFNSRQSKTHKKNLHLGYRGGIRV